MKRLFFASSFKDVSHLLDNLDISVKGKTVTFIPTASIVESVVFYVKAGRKALETLGATVDELEISTASPQEINQKLRCNDIIYVTGGNTFFLLQEFKRTGADRIIIEEVQAGKFYIGESAGAMIASKEIEYVKAMDSPKKAPDLSDYKALGLVDFFPVPHFGSFPFKKAAQRIIDTYSSSLNLVPITNQEAIVVEDAQFSVRKPK
ncbi:MAG: type 1 glutamine amidotransferase-like domain-containing protein [Chloroflexi bacterium]|nr:type 1 glutamine amidotransferase-like domain-containing protein [Chloroflexota bacterium]